MPNFLNFMYEKNKKKDVKPVQEAYLYIEELPYVPESIENPTKNIIIIDLITDEI